MGCWAGNGLEAIGQSTAEERCGLMHGFKRSLLLFAGGPIADAIRSLSKVQKTDAWAQAGVSVSRAAITKSHRVGASTTELYHLHLSAGHQPQIKGPAGP